MAKPKLIAFDLDYTLWPFWVDTHVDSPFHKKPNGEVLDRRGKIVEYYTDVPEILTNLSKDGYDLAVVSRTGEVKGANQLLDLFGWNSFFKFKEIYVGAKTKHFERIHRKSGISYRHMLFFDDEMRNIQDVTRMGVTCILVDRGVTKNTVERGLDEYRKKVQSP